MLLDGEGQQAVALAYGGTDCQARLIACTILDSDVLARWSPSRHLEVPGVEDGLVGEDQVTAGLLHSRDLLCKLLNQPLELLQALRLALGSPPDEHLLLLAASLPHELSQRPGSQQTIREPPFETHTPLLQAERSPFTQKVWVE